MLNKYSTLNKLSEIFSRFASPFAAGEIDGYRLVSTSVGRELEVSLTDGKLIRMPRSTKVNGWTMESIALDSSEPTAHNDRTPTARSIKAIISPFVNDMGSQRVLYLHSVTPLPPELKN